VLARHRAGAGGEQSGAARNGVHFPAAQLLQVEPTRVIEMVKKRSLARRAMRCEMKSRDNGSCATARRRLPGSSHSRTTERHDSAEVAVSTLAPVAPDRPRGGRPVWHRARQRLSRAAGSELGRVGPRGGDALGRVAADNAQSASLRARIDQVRAAQASQGGHQGESGHNDAQ
jgi:hypothetical protein